MIMDEKSNRIDDLDRRSLQLMEDTSMACWPKKLICFSRYHSMFDWKNYFRGIIKNQRIEIDYHSRLWCSCFPGIYLGKVLCMIGSGIIAWKYRKSWKHYTIGIKYFRKVILQKLHKTFKIHLDGSNTGLTEFNRTETWFHFRRAH